MRSALSTRLARIEANIPGSARRAVHVVAGSYDEGLAFAMARGFDPDADEVTVIVCPIVRSHEIHVYSVPEGLHA